MTQRGRPRTSTLTRAEQLRAAKRAQRARNAAVGLRTVRLELPEETAARLTVARQSRSFPDALESLLDRLVVRIADYPALKELAWNRSDVFIPAEEALALYERNWRFVTDRGVEAAEQALIDELVERYGGGVLNA